MANQDQLQGLLSYLSDENHIEAHLPFILESLLYNRHLDEESTDFTKFHKWITRMNSLLHSKNSTARWASISLINATCEQSNALYLANVSSWVLNILNVLQRPEPTSVHEIAIKTLTMLFSKTVDKPEVQREVTTPNLPKFNYTLLNLSGNRDLLSVIFDALSSSITNFPTTSRPVADNCRKLCLSLMDGSFDNRFELIEKASSCLATIFLTGTNANRPEIWKNTAFRLLGTANRSLDRLFDTIDEETTNTDRLPAYDFPPVMSDYSDAFIILFNRATALNEALVKTLTTSSQATVSVPVAQVVDYLCRIYNVNTGSLMRDFKDKSEYNCLMAGMPKLLLSTNRLFATLIHCCGNSLLRYLRLFSSLLLQLLTQNKHKRVIKVSLYEVITICLQKFGVGFGEMSSKPLLSIIFEDIRLPKKRSMPKNASSVNESATGKKSGKKRKRDLTNSDEIAHSQVEDSPQTLLLAGFEALQALLICYGSSLSAEQRSSIDSLLLTRILNDSHQLKTDNSKELVTEKLYECLLASVIRPIEAQASVLPQALRVFSAGANSQSHRLRVTCIQGLSVCELIMHARLPPIPRAESKAAPVVYIPGLGNVVDEKSVENGQRRKEIVEDHEMVDENVRAPAATPIKSFKDEISNLSQRVPASNNAFENANVEAVQAAMFQSRPETISTSHVPVEPQPKEVSETVNVGTKKMRTDVDLEEKRVTVDTARIVSSSVTTTEAPVAKPALTASNIRENKPMPQTDKRIPDAVAPAIASDDENMLDMPDIIMDGPDSDDDSE